MRRLAPLALSVALALGCKRTAPDTVVLPPPPPASTSAAASSTAAPTPVPASGHDLAIVGGTLVDVDAVVALHELTKDMVLSSAVRSDVAYAWARIVGGGEELRAYETKSGTLRWSKPATSCWQLVATSAGVFCGSQSGLQLFEAATGAPTALGPSAAVSSLTALGGRVIVVWGDKRLDVYDDGGKHVGNLTLPVVPDGGYNRGGLAIAGAVACGTQRSNAAVLAFCVDATPKILWQRSVGIPGGLLVDASADALVLASDTWTKTGVVSEVLRPKDGVSILRVPNVRLAGALTTAGVLDGALAVDPDVTLFDAKGTVKWTAHPSPFHREAARAVRSGPNIAVALYSEIATGAQLVAFDATSGAQVWTANVDTLPIAHSKYSNRVELDVGPAGLRLRGHESSQDYVQRFDPASGARTASVLRGR